MPSLPLKGIFTILFAGGAVMGISEFPQLLLVQDKKVPRLILGRGNNGQELYIRLADLKKQENISQEDREDGEDENFTGINLWLDNVQLDFRGKHSLESPNKDGKYYLLETKENSKFLGGEKIPDNDTRSSTLQNHVNNNPNYIQLEKDQWVGFSNYKNGTVQLEKIQSCVYSISKEEGYNSQIFIVCFPYQNTGFWNYRDAQYIAREFAKEEIVN